MTVEATVETAEAVQHVITFGDWFTGGHATFGLLAAQVGFCCESVRVALAYKVGVLYPDRAYKT